MFTKFTPKTENAINRLKEAARQLEDSIAGMVGVHQQGLLQEIISKTKEISMYE